jgi:small subunit ribosomal protein S16
MLRLRLRRVGSRHQPSYRIVAADSRAARDGAFIDYLGFYNPRTDPPTIEIDQEKARKWISQGAQPSEAVAQMLKRLETQEKAESE